MYIKDNIIREIRKQLLMCVYQICVCAFEFSPNINY